MLLPRSGFSDLKFSVFHTHWGRSFKSGQELTGVFQRGLGFGVLAGFPFPAHAATGVGPKRRADNNLSVFGCGFPLLG